MGTLTIYLISILIVLGIIKLDEIITNKIKKIKEKRKWI